MRLFQRFSFFLIVMAVSLGSTPGLASSELTSVLLAQAKTLRLSESRQWQRLNHYKKTFFGHFQSAIRGHFFLSSNGAVSPDQELDATIESMFSEDQVLRKNTQCRYLARREFLTRHLNIPPNQLEACEFSADWMRRLGAQRVSLIFASSFMDSAGSSFGHTFLKLNNPNNQGGLELTDYGLNFSARTSDTQGAMYALNGLFGGFPGAYSLLPFHQMMKDYINLEGRDIWEYSLNLSEEEVRRLIYAILEVEGTYFDYYFLDDNCSFQILKLLEIARPELELSGDDELFVIPLDTVKRIQKSQSLIDAELYRPSLNSRFRSHLKAVNRQAQFRIKEYLDESERTTARTDLSYWTTEELDLAQFYIDIKRSTDPTSFKSSKDQIARTRSHRGQVSVDQPPMPSSPTLAPDSSSLSVGVYERAALSGAEINFRFAFHDLLERDQGAARWSALEALAVRIRRESASERAYLEELKLLEMLSTSSVNPLFQPLSWGFKLGSFQNGDDLSHSSMLLQMKVGTSLDILPWKINDDEAWLRWSLFAKGSAQETPDLRYSPSVGVESFFLVSVFERMRAQLGVENLFYASGWEHFAWQGRALFDLSKSLELVTEWKQNTWGSPTHIRSDWSDKSLRMQYQFLF